MAEPKKIEKTIKQRIYSDEDFKKGLTTELTNVMNANFEYNTDSIKKNKDISNARKTIEIVEHLANMQKSINECFYMPLYDKFLLERLFVINERSIDYNLDKFKKCAFKKKISAKSSEEDNVIHSKSVKYSTNKIIYENNMIDHIIEVYQVIGGNPFALNNFGSNH